MKTLRRLDAAGFSLVELSVVVAILSGISAVLYSAFAAQTATTVRETGNAVAQNDARAAMDRMLRDLQTVGYDPKNTGLFGFVETEDDRVRFTTDANRDGLVQSTPDEKRGFDLSNGSLRVWLGGSSWRTLATSIDSLQFAYLDALGNATSVQSAIRQVNMTIGVRSTGRSPGMNYQVRLLTGTAYLRNK